MNTIDVSSEELSNNAPNIHRHISYGELKTAVEYGHTCNFPSWADRLTIGRNGNLEFFKGDQLASEVKDPVVLIASHNLWYAQTKFATKRPKQLESLIQNALELWRTPERLATLDYRIEKRTMVGVVIAGILSISNMVNSRAGSDFADKQFLGSDDWDDQSLWHIANQVGMVEHDPRCPHGGTRVTRRFKRAWDSLIASGLMYSEQTRTKAPSIKIMSDLLIVGLEAISQQELFEWRESEYLADRKEKIERRHQKVIQRMATRKLLKHIKSGDAQLTDSTHFINKISSELNKLVDKLKRKMAGFHELSIFDIAVYQLTT